MSKSSMRKRSMYQLGKQHGPYYRYPWYPRSRDYMRGYNKHMEPKYEDYYVSHRLFWFATAFAATLLAGALMI